ncbi:hypothetical protein DFH09DRAFT_1424725 [Mycena vulgaris]|nr:hypothetical protein DFH09DRAFT_1424725 [Mycena vulgaris]
MLLPFALCISWLPPGFTTRRPRDIQLPPKQRVKIRQRRLSKQPHSRLMNHPLELRRLIYDYALGGYWVDLRLGSSPDETHYVADSTCYELLEFPEGLPPLLHPIAIPTALLQACRQLYFKALPILHHRTTFRLQVSALKTILNASLGSHYIPGIRSLYLLPSYGSSPLPWDSVFAVLRKMRLRSLVFELDVLPLEGTELDLVANVLRGAWARGVLGLRDLRYFDVVLYAPEHLLLRIDLMRRLRTLLLATR